MTQSTYYLSYLKNYRDKKHIDIDEKETKIIYYYNIKQ